MTILDACVVAMQFAMEPVVQVASGHARRKFDQAVTCAAEASSRSPINITRVAKKAVKFDVTRREADDGSRSDLCAALDC